MLYGRVEVAKKCGPSGRALAHRLDELDYDGPIIHFGFAGKYVDKYLALRRMEEAGIPVPELNPSDYPMVGRKSRHRGGSGLWICHSEYDRRRAMVRGATHFLAFIENAREFRVHVVAGKSIKISEKIGGGSTKNFKAGARFYYPWDLDDKDRLREIGKAAVLALNLPFGAVDVLYKDDEFYVLEVNSAPCLTNTKSDTLERYAQAFIKEHDEKTESDY